MRVLEAFDNSVRALVSDGALDEVRQGPAIEAARKIAEVMDSPGWPMVDGKLDNVSPGVFLKYCDALGITGKVASAGARKGAISVSMVGNSKWAQRRAANG